MGELLAQTLARANPSTCLVPLPSWIRGSTALQVTVQCRLLSETYPNPST